MNCIPIHQINLYISSKSIMSVKFDRKEYKAQWYQANKDRLKEKAKKWREENPEQEKENNKSWVEKNRERHNELGRNWRKNNPDKVRNMHLKQNYGITLEEYNKILESQGFCCGLCGKAADKVLHVDHCHKTGKVRGLLCHSCNTSLGKFNEDPALLRKAADWCENV